MDPDQVKSEPSRIRPACWIQIRSMSRFLMNYTNLIKIFGTYFLKHLSILAEVTDLGRAVDPDLVGSGPFCRIQNRAFCWIWTSQSDPVKNRSDPLHWYFAVGHNDAGPDAGDYDTAEHDVAGPLTVGCYPMLLVTVLLVEEPVLLVVILLVVMLQVMVLLVVVLLYSVHM